MTLKNAIDIALKNNFDIQIARKNTDINRLNNSYGIAGGLPSINGTAGDNSSSSNIDQQLSSGSEIISKNAAGNTLTAGVTGGIVLFNGFKVVATKERLNNLQKQSELQLNLQIQNTMASVMVKYYDIIRQNIYLKILRSSLDVSKQKLDIVTERKNVGMANDADYLQAKIDANIAEQNVKVQELTIEQDKTDFLQLISAKDYNPIEINDSIIVDNNIKLDTIINYLKQNPQYLSAEQQIRINEQIVREVNSQRYPSVKLNTGYNYSRVKSNAGSMLLNQSYGPFAGFSLQIPIYNGNQYKTQKDVAINNVNIAKLQQENLLNSLFSDAIKSWQAYNINMQQLHSQLINYELSKKLVDVVLQRFQQNQATIIDIKTAQTSFENAGYLLVNLQYAAKSAEIELNRLIYRLGN
ncbi:MAG: TolC family protein [Bacteroidota bacterium]|nr:TolC family protein [Bacteroidota bacterium]